MTHSLITCAQEEEERGEESDIKHQTVKKEERKGRERSTLEDDEDSGIRVETSGEKM